MLTLAAWLKSEDVTNAEFARRMTARLGKRVSDQNVWRWTLPASHPEYSIPEPDNLVAIYFETAKQVKVEVWYGHMINQRARRVSPARRRAA
jgi:hypothetical protein